jgi:ComEC/Rec2-related protein
VPRADFGGLYPGIIRKVYAGDPADENHILPINKTAADSSPSAIKNTPGIARHIKLISILLILPACVALKIYGLNDVREIDPSCGQFRGTVRDIRMLSYSQEAVIGFFEYEESKPAGTEMLAVTYIPRSVKMSSGDLLEIWTRPVTLKIGDNDGSPFTIDHIRRGIRYVFHLKDNNFTILESASETLKEKIRTAIEKNISSNFNRETSSLLIGLYLANKNYIDKETVHEFKKAGVLHILAASGSHVAIIALMPLLILGVFRIDKKIIYVISLTILSFYLYVTDMPVSLLRAYIMCLIFYAQHIFDFDKNILNAFFLSGVPIIIICPGEIYGLGTQLTFGATLGIILFFSLFRDSLEYMPAFIKNSLAVTLSAQVFVYPIILFQLNEVNLAALVSNVVVVAVIDLILMASIMANILFFAAPGILKYCACAIDQVYHYTRMFVKIISGFNGHFTDCGAMFLVIPFIIYLMPLFPAARFRKLLSLFIVFSFSIAWFYLSGSRAESDMAVLKRSESSSYVVRDGDMALIYGTISDMSEARDIVRYLDRSDVNSVSLYIPVIDYKSARYYSFIVKNAVVKKCYISSGSSLGGYIKNFLEILDIDGVKLEMRDFGRKKRLSDHEMAYFQKIVKSQKIDDVDSAFYRFLKDRNSGNKNIAALREAVPELKICYL